MATQRYTTLPAFTRGDTPLLYFGPLTDLTGNNLDFTGWNAYVTFNVAQYPTDNSTAFLHKTMTYSGYNLDPLGLGVVNYFYYQCTNADTENFDPNTNYYWDLEVNKSPTSTNNFTILTGRFQPLGDISRGLT